MHLAMSTIRGSSEQRHFLRHHKEQLHGDFVQVDLTRGNDTQRATLVLIAMAVMLSRLCFLSASTAGAKPAIDSMYPLR